MTAYNEKISCVDRKTTPSYKKFVKGNKTDEEELAELAQEMLTRYNIKVNTQPTPGPCPAGSVSMILPTREAIVYAGSLDKYLHKYGTPPVPDSNNKPASTSTPTPLASTATAGDGYIHEYAVAGRHVPGPIGVQATLNVWTPTTAANNNASISQLWLVAGSGSTHQAVEAGWHVSPSLYQGSTLPHFFIYFRTNGALPDGGGCHNIGCGFMPSPTSPLTPGALLSSSVANGAQVEGTLAFYKIPTSSASTPAGWYLYSVDNPDSPQPIYTTIGYYPLDLFGAGLLGSGDATTVAANSAVEFGGEISTSSNSPHTSTQMGSGQFANTGYQRAAYQRKLKYADKNGTITNFASDWTTVTNTNCYTLLSSPPSVGYYFGGPGNNGANSCQ